MYVSIVVNMKIIIFIYVVFMFMVLVIVLLFLSVWIVWFGCEFSRFCIVSIVIMMMV